jgi:hypothetical protein
MWNTQGSASVMIIHCGPIGMQAGEGGEPAEEMRVSIFAQASNPAQLQQLSCSQFKITTDSCSQFEIHH